MSDEEYVRDDLGFTVSPDGLVVCPECGALSAFAPRWIGIPKLRCGICLKTTQLSRWLAHLDVDRLLRAILKARGRHFAVSYGGTGDAAVAWHYGSWGCRSYERSAETVEAALCASYRAWREDHPS